MNVQVVEISELDLAFGRVEGLLPAREDIPKEFFNHQNKWHRIVSKWFFDGLKVSQFKPKENIDKTKALRHVAAVLKSFEPSHEHKTAGCAYLLSNFFEDVEE